jgi:hypothetical protein
MIAKQEPPTRDAERHRKRREDPLVDGSAGLEPSDGPNGKAGRFGEVIDAGAACEAKAKDTRRCRFYRHGSSVAVPRGDRDDGECFRLIASP